MRSGGGIENKGVVDEGQVDRPSKQTAPDSFHDHHTDKPVSALWEAILENTVGCWLPGKEGSTGVEGEKIR